MYFSRGVIWKGKGKSVLHFTILVLSLQSEGKLRILYKGRLTSILSKRKTFGFHTSFRYVVHLPTVETLTAFAIWRQLAQLFSNEDNLFTALSSCCDLIKQLASFKVIKFTEQQWVSELVTDKGSQWSDSGRIKLVHWIMPFGISTSEYEDRAITIKSKQSRCVKRFFLIRGIDRRKEIKTAVMEVFTTWVSSPV